MATKKKAAKKKPKFNPKKATWHPATLGEAMTEALADLAKVEKLKAKYRVDMFTWHDMQQEGDGKCAVCFAGSVMAITLDAPLSVDLSPQHFDAKTKRALISMDALRCGQVGDAIYEFYGPKKFDAIFHDGSGEPLLSETYTPLSGTEYMSWDSGTCNPDWWKAARALAKQLVALGI